MKNVNFKRVLKQAKFHGEIMLRGLALAIWGTLIVGTICFTGYGFWLIKTESGYAAVLDFILVCAMLILALVNIYVLGIKRRGAKK